MDDEMLFPDMTAMAILQQAKDYPGSRKSELYTTARDKKVVEMLIMKDMLRMDHPNKHTTCVSILPDGSDVLDAMWALADAMMTTEKVSEWIVEKIDRNKRDYSTRHESAALAQKKRAGLVLPRSAAPDDRFILVNGVYKDKELYEALQAEKLMKDTHDE